MAKKEKNKEIDKQFGMRLGELREKRGMKQSELAAIVDISSKTISAYETYKRNPSIVIVKKLAEALSVSPVYFFGEESSQISVKVLEQEPVLALLTVINMFRFHTHVLDDKTIQLTISDDNKSYSGLWIKEFFKEYEIVQDFIDKNSNTDSGDEMSNKLIEHLRDKYQFLPGFPNDYPYR